MAALVGQDRSMPALPGRRQVAQAAAEARPVLVRSANPRVHPEQKPASRACLKAEECLQAPDSRVAVVVDQSHLQANTADVGRDDDGAGTFVLSGDEGS